MPVSRQVLNGTGNLRHYSHHSQVLVALSVSVPDRSTSADPPPLTGGVKRHQELPPFLAGGTRNLTTYRGHAPVAPRQRI